MILKNYQVLAANNDQSVFLSKHNQLFLLNLDNKALSKIFEFPINTKTYLSKCSPVLRRLLRTDIRYGLKIDEDHLVVVREGNFYCLNYKTRELVSTIKLPRGTRPLNMLKLSNINSFEDGVYFGEYFSNPQKLEASIYRYTKEGLENKFTFPAGAINHIHNLVPDPERDCVWILAGDFEDGAAIYQARNNFKEIKRIVFGEQTYRSCVAFPIPEGLLYATDSQFERNSIRLLSYKKNGWISKKIKEINGPCIFGTKKGEDFIFSTSVEAINSGNIFQKMLRNKRGPGIIKNQSDIIKGNLQSGFKVIYSNQKDFLPFILFQFGNILFPSGITQTDKLIFTNIATVKNDFSTQIISI